MRTLFYSPIAWFLMIVFFIQCGLAYLRLIKGIARTQELGGMEINFLDTLTSGIFTGMSGVFSSVMATLYLYIPLLTMSLISRETGSGTIKLLYSSPIKIREIVLGKYLAMVMYSLVLIAILGVFVVSGLFHIQYPETGMLMTALLGFFLLLCAYSAIGLFMSTLTTYQVVAAIASFIMIGILSYIGNLWQRIGFVRELTYFLSMSGRTQKMMAGLLTSKDVVYFIAIVFLFLGFSVYRLKGSLESKPWTVKGLRYAVVLSIVLLVGYVTSIPGLIGYYDATHNKLNTLTPRTQQIVKDLGDDPMEVTAYANLVDRHYFLGDPDSYNKMLARWDPYLRFKSNIKVKTISYYDSAFASPYIFQLYPGKTLKEIADQHAKKYDMKLSDYLTPEQIRASINLRPQFNRYVMQLKWRGREAWLRVFDDSQTWPSETELSIVLKRLQGAKMPKVGFVTGNLERDINKLNDNDYGVLTSAPFFRYSMVNQGFDVQTVSLEAGLVPAELSALVLADPKLDLSPASRAALSEYINRGGNLLISGEPGRQAQMNVLLKDLGVQLTDGILIQESEDETPLMAAQQLSSFSGTFYPPLGGAAKDSIPVTMPGAAGLAWTDSSSFAIRPLLQSAPKVSWNRRKRYDPETMVAALVKPRDTLLQKMPPGLITFSAADGDVMGPVTTAVSLSRTIHNKEQRIIVTGDADFMNNKEVNRYGTANFVFCTGSFRWLTGGEYPIDASRPAAKDKRINVTLSEAEVLRIVYIWIVPGLLLAFGTILLIRRKRK